MLSEEISSPVSNTADNTKLPMTHSPPTLSLMIHLYYELTTVMVDCIHYFII